MCCKTENSTPEYNRQGFKNKIMGKIKHKINIENEEVHNQVDDINCIN